jgi:uncharacterized NAD(P)/FAD-binding protein YdhS
MQVVPVAHRYAPDIAQRYAPAPTEGRLACVVAGVGALAPTEGGISSRYTRREAAATQAVVIDNFTLCIVQVHALHFTCSRTWWAPTLGAH